MFKKKIVKEIEKAEKDIENGDYKEFESADDLINDLFGRRTWFKSYIWYPICRFFDAYVSIRTWWYRLKRLKVFLTKGFDPKDTWSLDYTMAKWVLPRLKYLKKVKHGTPFIDGFDELWASNTATEEEMQPVYDAWDGIMEQMINAFTLVIKDGDGECLTNEEDELIVEGMKLFARYYRNLWD